LTVKKFGEKASLQGLANADLHHQPMISIKMKPNEAIPNYNFACVARPPLVQSVIACNISTHTKQ